MQNFFLKEHNNTASSITCSRSIETQFTKIHTASCLLVFVLEYEKQSKKPRRTLYVHSDKKDTPGALEAYPVSEE